MARKRRISNPQVAERPPLPSIMSDEQERRFLGRIPAWLENKSIPDSTPAPAATNGANTVAEHRLLPKWLRESSEPDAVVEGETTDLSGRVASTFFQGLVSTEGLQDIIFQAPLALMPDVLKGVPTSKLAEQAFGTRLSPDQAFDLLSRDLETRPGDRDNYIRSQRADIVRLAEAQDVVQIARRELMRTNVFGVEGPPDTVMEKIAETAGGLAAFMGRVAMLNRTMGFPLQGLPKYFSQPVIWEIESQLGGGSPGASAEFSLGLQTIEALPIPKIPKTAIESAAFYGVALASGADEVDAYIMAAIPPAARGATSLGGMKIDLARFLRKARTNEEMVTALERIHAVGTEARAANAGRPEPKPESSIKQHIGLLTEANKAEAKQDINDFRDINRKRMIEGLEPISRPGLDIVEGTGKPTDVRAIDVSKVEPSESAEIVRLIEGVEAQITKINTPLAKITPETAANLAKLVPPPPPVNLGVAQITSAVGPSQRTDSPDTLEMVRRIAVKMGAGEQIAKTKGLKGKRVLDTMRRTLGRLPTPREIDAEVDFGPKARAAAKEILKQVPIELKKIIDNPKVISQVGPGGDPVMRDDMLNPIKFKPSDPAVYQSYEQFEAHFNQGRTDIPQFIAHNIGNNAKDLWDFLVKDGRIKIRAKPKQTKARVARLGAQIDIPQPSESSSIREIPFESLPEGEFAGEALTPEQAVEIAEFAAKWRQHGQDFNEALAELSEVKRDILMSLNELHGTEPKTLRELSDQWGISTEEVIALENQATVDISIATGQSLPETSVEEYFARSDPYRHRRGMVLVPPLRQMLDLLPMVGRMADRFIAVEARSMTQLLRRYGNPTDGKQMSNTIADFFNVIIDQQQAYMGQFAEAEVRAKKLMRRLDMIRAGWNLQQRPYPKLRDAQFAQGQILVGTHADDGRGGTIRVAGRYWVIDAFADIARGDMEPRTDAERRLVQLTAWDMHSQTGDLLMSDPVKLQIQAPNGDFLPFKKAVGGRTFLSMPTQEMYDVLFRGRGMDDRIWERYEQGLAESEGIDIIVAQRHMNDLREIVMDNNPQIGYRHIGPELMKRFKRPPTGVQSRNGTHIQMLHTEPQQYMISGYKTTSVRAGFIQYMGQDGSRVQLLKKMYTHPENSGLAPTFDAVVRALSDVPPAFLAQSPVPLITSPESLEYSMGRGYAALLEVIKQGYLSQTAPIQLSEPLAFITLTGHKALIRGIKDTFRSRASFRAMMSDLTSNRLITKNIVSFMIDRSHPASSLLRTFAGVLSKAHLNDYANELANELPAGILARARMSEIIDRGRRTGDPSESDMHYFRDLLEYPENIARRLALGQGTSAEYMAAARRGSRVAVSSTATTPQKSPLRQTRYYSYFFPFTNFFSGRISLLDKEYRSLKTSFKLWEKDPGNVQLQGRLFTSAYKFAITIGSMGLAGVLATYIVEVMKQGPAEGIAQRNRDLGNDPVQFFQDAFVWATFGPVYGAFYNSLASASDNEEPAENIIMQFTRIALPISAVANFIDVLKGTGQYKNRSGWERSQRYLELNLPLINTIPGMHIASLLGITVEDPRTRAAVREYWKWMYDKDNESVPGGGGTPGSRTDAEKQVAIHLRRARENQDKGIDPMSELRRAFLAGDLEVDLRAAILNWTLLDRKELNDVKRADMEKDIGTRKMNILRHRDNNLRFLAERTSVLSQMGRENKVRRKELENLLLESTVIKP